ncbi:MAG: ABC-type transport auxiliary lipoprotein family protein [Pseudolabrys sp.]
METRARYLVIGAFVLVCIFAAFGFAYWIKNNVGIGRTVYRVDFEQPVSGLTPGSGVLFNGVKVGAVVSVKLDPQDPKRVAVLIAVDDGTPLRTDTQVDISFQGLTGAPAISLKGGSLAAPVPRSQNGEPAMLTASPTAGQTLTDSAQTTLRNLDAVLAENKKPLHTAITGISTFAEALGKNSNRLDGLIGGLEKMLGVGGSKETPAVYDLKAATSFPAFSKSITQQMVVSDVNTIIAYDTQKILIKAADGTYSDVENAKWADNLPKLIQARIVQSFENAKQLATVSRPIDQLEAAFRLDLGIRNFQISLQPAPAAVIEIAARLLDDKGKVADARIFKVAVPAKGTSGPDAAAALNQAFAQFAAQLVTWTVGLI